MKITHSLTDVTDWFFATLDTLVEKKLIATVGLAGGSSLDSWYKYLLENTKQQTQNTMDLFNKIRWCVTDERVNCDISDRNDEHIWQLFLKPLFAQFGIPEENFIRPGMDDDGVQYSHKVGEIDIGFFGIGPDGHTASLFPHSREVSAFLETPLPLLPNPLSSTHSAIPSTESSTFVTRSEFVTPPLVRGNMEVEFIKIENAPKLPPERISLSPTSIQSLEHVCLFAVGESKKEALAKFRDDSVRVMDCPAKLLKPEIVFDGTH